MQTASSSGRQPKYRLHKPSGNAVVTLYGRDLYLGKHGSKDSKVAYSRLMLEWVANDGVAPPPKTADLTIVELANAYKRWAKLNYVRKGVSISNYKKVEMVMKNLGSGPYGETPAREFGPTSLKALQRELADKGKARRYVNDLIDIIRRCFKWAVSEELVPVSVHQALETVVGLRQGRSKARETAPVLPVAASVVDATIPYLPPVVVDMIGLLRILGCRPQELCDLRPCDVDCTDEIWVYRPERHKTAHRGRGRSIPIGPKAQAILAPYLQRNATECCFSPAESDTLRRAKLHLDRKTPLSCGNRPGTNRSGAPKHTPGMKYCPTALNRAVRRACDKADGEAHKADPTVDKSVRCVPRWFVYQLRHSVATNLRNQFGLEAARVILGHSKADTTLLYAERDLNMATDVMLKVG